MNINSDSYNQTTRNPLCPMCGSSRIIEHNGGQWCTICGVLVKPIVPESSAHLQGSTLERTTDSSGLQEGERNNESIPVMRFGFLDMKGSPLQRILGVFCLALGLLIIIRGIVILSGNDDASIDVFSFFLAAILIIISLLLILSRNSKNWKAGQRLCHGLIWDTANCMGWNGNFILKINTRSEIDPRNKGIRNFTVLDIAQNEPVRVQNSSPELVLTLSKNYGESYHIEHMFFAKKCVYHCDLSSRINVLVNDGITSIRVLKLGYGGYHGYGGSGFNGLCIGLRKIGQLLQSLGTHAQQVRLCVTMPRPPKPRQGVGLPTATKVGIVGAVALGVAPILGALAAGAVTSNTMKSDDNFFVQDIEQVRLLVFGHPKKSTDSLKSIAEEFKWTIEGPEGIILGRER